MVYGEPLDSILNFLSGFFHLPVEWLNFPAIIFYLFVPLIALTAMWYTFLHEKLRLFHSTGASLGISIVISMLSIWLVAAFGPVFATSTAIGITILVMGRFTFKRIIIAIAIMIVLFYVLSPIFGMFG